MLDNGVLFQTAIHCLQGAFFNHRTQTAAVIVLFLRPSAGVTRAAAFPESIFGAAQEGVPCLDPQCGFPIGPSAYLPLPINAAVLRI